MTNDSAIRLLDSITDDFSSPARRVSDFLAILSHVDMKSIELEDVHEALRESAHRAWDDMRAIEHTIALARRTLIDAKRAAA